MLPEYRPPSTWLESGPGAGAIPLILGVAALLPGLIWLCGRCRQKRPAEQQQAQSNPRRSDRTSECGKGSSSPKPGDRAVRTVLSIRGTPITEGMSQRVTVQTVAERPTTQSTSGSSSLPHPTSAPSKNPTPAYTLIGSRDLPMPESSKAACSGTGKLQRQQKPISEIAKDATDTTAEAGASDRTGLAEVIATGCSAVIVPAPYRQIPLVAGCRSEDVEKHSYTSEGGGPAKRCCEPPAATGRSHSLIRTGDDTSVRAAGLSPPARRLAPSLQKAVVTCEQPPSHLSMVGSIQFFPKISGPASGTAAARLSTHFSQELLSAQTETLRSHEGQRESTTPQFHEENVQPQQTESRATWGPVGSHTAELKLAALATHDTPLQGAPGASSRRISQDGTSPMTAGREGPLIVASVSPHQMVDSRMPICLPEAAISQSQKVRRAASPLRLASVESYRNSSSVDPVDHMEEALLRTAAAAYVDRIIKHTVNVSRPAEERLASTIETIDSASALTKLSASSLYYDC